VEACSLGATAAPGAVVALLGLSWVVVVDTFAAGGGNIGLPAADILGSLFEGMHRGGVFRIVAAAGDTGKESGC